MYFHESPIHRRSLWQMAQACKLVHHAHEVIPFQKQTLLARILCTNLEQLHELYCKLQPNIVCACKGLMGGPARACTVQKHSQSLCNRNGTAHDCVLLR